MTVVLKVRLLAAVITRAFFKLVEFFGIKVNTSPIGTVIFAFPRILQPLGTVTLILIVVLGKPFAHKIALLAAYSLHL